VDFGNQGVTAQIEEHACASVVAHQKNIQLESKVQ
jgi:hypothetical protein